MLKFKSEFEKKTPSRCYTQNISNCPRILLIGGNNLQNIYNRYKQRIYQTTY